LTPGPSAALESIREKKTVNFPETQCKPKSSQMFGNRREQIISLRFDRGNTKQDNQSLKRFGQKKINQVIWDLSKKIVRDLRKSVGIRKENQL